MQPSSRHYQNGHTIRIAMLLLAICALLAGCGAGDNNQNSQTSQAVPTNQPERVFFYEREFADQPTLAARRHQTVILDLQPGSTATAQEHITRHQLEQGLYRFCMEQGESYLTGMVLEDGAGKAVIKLDRTSGCVEASLPADVYRMRMMHDASAVAGAKRVAFVRAPAPVTPLLGTDGKPLGGWWALQPDPSLDPTGQQRQGRVTMRNSSIPATQLLQPDFASQQFDGSSLFRFTDPSYPFEYFGSPGTPPGSPVRIGFTPINSSIYPVPLDFFTFPFKDMGITDLGSYRMQFGKSHSPRAGAAGSENFYAFDLRILGADVGLTFVADDTGSPPSAPATPVTVLFRFYQDGTQIGPLNEGEAALFQQCGYQGKAIVLTGAVPDLADISSSITTLNRTVASVKLGNNTSVLLNSGPKYTGALQVVKLDTPCLPGTPDTESVQVQPLANVILLSSKSCKGCRLVGADMSNRDLSGGVDLSGADLSGAKVNNSNLTGAILHKAMLKQADFGHAILNGALLDNANLESANLFNASLTNQASLQGAHLKNANLAQASLSGADFSYANFYGANDAASTGICQTDTSQCPFSKTGFTCACASAAGATMDGTKFVNAYLYGVDFSGATPLTNVDFSSAVLISSVFSGRTITKDKDSTATSSFSAAYLQGARLAGATLDAITLKDAFVDFTQGGNDLSIVLSEAHTGFAGSTSSGAVCVNPIYGSPTTVPFPTASSIICPDGSKNPDGCGNPAADGSNTRWKSSVDIGRWSTPGWYDMPPSPTFPPISPQPPVCNGLTVNANW
jgi:uncharacterized protein YjbI with pentapeptide repeats